MDGPGPEDIAVINFFSLIGKVSSSRSTDRAAHIDTMLASCILEFLGYQRIVEQGKPPAELVLHHDTGFEMNGVRTKATIDVGLLNQSGHILSTFVEDKQLDGTEWPHAQVVAQSLGVYDLNINRSTDETRYPNGMCIGNEPNLVDMIIPAFTFVGSQPYFYIVPVTASLYRAVALGGKPHLTTQVFYCPAPIKYDYVGMTDRSQRLLILSMFEAFKKIIPRNFAELCRFGVLAPPSASIPPPLNLRLFNTNVLNWAHYCIWEVEESYRKRDMKKLHFLSGRNNYLAIDERDMDEYYRVMEANLPNSTLNSPPPTSKPYGYSSDFMLMSCNVIIS